MSDPTLFEPVFYERFIAKVTKTETCWLWEAATSPEGYGRFATGGNRRWLAHRWSYEYHSGPIPDGPRRCSQRQLTEPRKASLRRGLSHALGESMGKHCCLPPGALDELITRIEALEERLAAIDAAARAFAVVFAIPRIPDKPGG